MKSYVVQYKTAAGDLESKVLDKSGVVDLIKNKHEDNMQIVSVFTFDDKNELVRLQHRVTDLIEVKFHEIRDPISGFLELNCFAR